MLTAGLTTNVEELHTLVASMEAHIRQLKEQLVLTTHQRFGKKSEGFSPDQLALFTTSDVDIVIEEKAVTEKESKETKPKRIIRQAVIVSRRRRVTTVITLSLAAIIMNYSDIIDALDKASAFDLYRLQMAIDNMIDDPKRIIEIKMALRLDQEIEHYDASSNRMEPAIVKQIKQTKAVVKNLKDGKR